MLDRLARLAERLEDLTGLRGGRLGLVQRHGAAGEVVALDVDDDECSGLDGPSTGTSRHRTISAPQEAIPDSETGLRIMRWNLGGFEELRSRGLLSPRGEYEVIDGFILHRDGGSRRHDAVVKELAGRLLASAGSPEVSVERDFELLFADPEAAVTPDLVVLDERSTAPRLVVEVSEESSRVDAMEKEHVHARAGVEEYWRIGLPWRLMYVHSSPWPDGYGCRSLSPNGMAAMTHVALRDELMLEDLLATADTA